MSDNKNDGKEKRTLIEEFKISGSEIVDKVKDLIHQGNIRRITIKNEDGKNLLEIPLTLGLVGVALAPVLAAIGALAAIVGKVTVVVEKEDDKEDEKIRTKTARAIFMNILFGKYMIIIMLKSTQRLILAPGHLQEVNRDYT